MTNNDLRLSPEQVIYLSGGSPKPRIDALRQLWFEKNGEEPVATGHGCIRSRRFQRMWSWPTMIAGIALVVASFVFMAEADKAEELYVTGKAAADSGDAMFSYSLLCLAVGIIIGVIGLSGVSESGRKAFNFQYKEGNFGHDFGYVYDLLKDLEVMQIVQEENPEWRQVFIDKATQILDEQAYKLKKAEKANLAKYIGFKINGKPTKESERERDEFSRLYDLFIGFGLADPNGWGPYDQHAEERLLREAQGTAA